MIAGHETRREQRNLLRAAASVLLLSSFAATTPTQSAAAANQHGAENDGRATPTVLRDLDSAIDEMAGRVAPAVVQVLVSGLGSSRRLGEGVMEHQRGIGSGVIVDPNGYVITNAHVVSGARRIRVQMTSIGSELVPGKTSLLRRQRTYEAKLVGMHRLTDLALLKIDASGLPFIPLKDPESFRVRLGQTVLAIGSPEGLEHTITMGIVSAPGRQPELDRPMIYIQTDAPINPGNSGGALVDRDGNLVDINTFILSRSGGSEGLGFAVPAPTVSFIYRELKQYGRVRMNAIGVNAQTITPTMAAGLSLPRDWGVILSDVLPGGPAEKAGLHPQDIINEVDGVPIDSLPKFTVRMYLHPHDKYMALGIQRGEEKLQISVLPADIPNSVDNLADLVDPKNGLVSTIGVFVLDLDKPLAQNLPEMRSEHGVIVVAKVDYAPAIETELEAGDVIQAVNGTPIRNGNELRSRLSSLPTGSAVVLQIERQGLFRFMSFEME
jgi:serine protease Do